MAIIDLVIGAAAAIQLIFYPTNSAFNLATSVAAVPILFISALVVLWERTRLRLQCDPVLRIQEYPTHYGISPITTVNATDVEGYLTIIVKQGVTYPVKRISCLELEIPSAFNLVPTIVQISMIDTTKDPSVSHHGSSKTVSYLSNSQFTARVLELRFYVQAPRGAGIARLQENCKVRLRYKYSYLNSKAEEGFEIITF